MLAATVQTGGPVEPLPADAPPDRFSAHRALEVLRRISTDRPRPTGSPENTAFRTRLTREIEALGLPVREHHSRGFTNLLTRIEGEEPGVVLLMAHHDSVASGPGANDNGVGVVSLVELARALSLEAPLHHPVVLLFDDGEEKGLWGARLFRAEHPWMDEVRAIIDLEARGVRGPSLMFQTIGASGWMVDLMARHHPHPVSSSGFAAVYEHMPNDTNLSVFREDGIAGLDFAYIGGVEHYHRRTDDLDHVDLHTVQHHGEGVLELTRAVAASDLGEGRTDRRVFFDVFGMGVLGWPEHWSLGLAALGLLGVRRPGWIGGVVGMGMVLIGTLVATGLLWTLMGSLAAAQLSALVAVLLVGPRVAEARNAVWGLWGLAGLAMAWAIPGLCYLFVVPTFVAACVTPWRSRWTAVVPALVASMVWMRALTLLPDALGAHLWWLHGLATAVFATVWLPVLAIESAEESA